ncbi:MAG: signal peptidase II [Bdellovibrio sp.]|nr:MAG: signal peptidase II [Bdellovibrio sp.]
MAKCGMGRKVKFIVHRTCLIFSLLFTTVGCDQLTKQLVRDSLPLIGSLSYLNDSIRFQYARNPGGFLSLGAGFSEGVRFWVFNVAVSVFLAGLAWTLFHNRRTRAFTLVGLSLILGGGIGNLIDRFIFGSVTDFLIFGIGPIKTGIFNFADTAIVLGAALIFLANWKPKGILGAQCR